MITLKTLEDKEFNIANSYEELTLGQYTDIIKIGESKIKLEGVKSDIQIISTLSDNPKELSEYLWNIPQEDFNELVSYFDWVNDSNIIDTFKNLKLNPIITIEDKEYSVITDYAKMTLNEQSSFEEILKTVSEGSDLHKLDVAFGVLLRPMKDGQVVKFNLDVFDEVMNIRYKVKMIDIYSALAFFLSIEKKSSQKITKAFSLQVR